MTAGLKVVKGLLTALFWAIRKTSIFKMPAVPVKYRALSLVAPRNIKTPGIE
jgi:hypothetical protein